MLRVSPHYPEMAELKATSHTSSTVPNRCAIKKLNIGFHVTDHAMSIGGLYGKAASRRLASCNALRRRRRLADAVRRIAIVLVVRFESPHSAICRRFFEIWHNFGSANPEFA